MKRLTWFLSLLGLFLSLPVLVIAQQADNVQKSSVTQKMGAKEITVVAVDRKESYSDGFATFTPKAGEEIALVRLNVQFTQAENGISLKCPDIELRDSNDNKYNCAVGSLSAEADNITKPWEAELPFFVPKGTRFKAFRIKDISFDLEELESKQKK